MKNCNEIREKISLYIDNELPADELAEFKEHICTCPDCRRECDEVVQIVGLCRDMPEAELPVNFREELHDKLLAAATENVSKSGVLQRARYIRIISSIAAGFILIFLVSGIYRFGFTNLKTGDSTGNISMKAAQAAEPEQPNMNESFSAAATANDGVAQFSLDAGSSSGQSSEEAAPAADRSSSSENRITQPPVNTSGTAAETASSRTVSLTILVDDPVAQVDSVKAIAVQYGGEEQPQPLLKSASIAALDTPVSNNEIVLTYFIPNKQYDSFTQSLGKDYGQSNIEPGALVSEDLTGTLNSLIEQSNVLNADIKKLEEAGAAANADKIGDIKAEKDTVQNQIENIRLNTDFTNVTIIMKKK